MDKQTYKRNIAWLEANDISLVEEKIWEDYPYSVELETYTGAGEDMLIDLEEPSKQGLQKYINDFDVNGQVTMWWSNGAEQAHKKGVPFNNIKEHYEDYENFLQKLQTLCDTWGS